MSLISLETYEKNYALIDFGGNFDDYEFSINGAFTYPFNINGTKYEFKYLTPGTHYKISLYNFDAMDMVPTTEVTSSFVEFTTPNQVDQRIKTMFGFTEITSTSIKIILLDAPSFNMDFLSINDKFAPNVNVVSVFNQQKTSGYILLTGLSPSTTYSIQYNPDPMTDSIYLKTTEPVDPPVDPSPGPGSGADGSTSTGLSDGARIGIIFGSVFAFFLLYYMFYL